MRFVAASGFAACAVVLAAASFAWACEPGIVNGATTISANPSSVAVGTGQITVTGSGWTNRESVAFRWSTGAAAGSAVPGGEFGRFNSSASVPDLPAGNYTLIATQPSSGKSYSLPLRITAIRPASEIPAQEQPGNTGNTAATGPVTPVQGGATGTSTSGGTGSAPAVEPTATPVPSAGPTPSPSATTGGGTSGVIPDRAPAASTAPAAVAEPAPVASIPAITGGPVSATAPVTSAARPRTTPGPKSVPAKVSRPATNKASSAEAASPERNKATDPAPSPKTASGELWSGFSQATGPSAGPSLTDLPASSGHAPSNLAVGVGMLSAGLVALFAGFGVAEARRRRVLVTRSGG